MEVSQWEIKNHPFCCGVKLSFEVHCQYLPVSQDEKQIKFCNCGIFGICDLY